MLHKTVTRTLAVLSLLIFLAPTASSQLTPVVDSILMRDGRKLTADIYKPAGITKGPVILIQTPYNRLFYRLGLPLQIGLNLNSSNYIFVIIDWRGFYGSASAAHAGSPGMGEDGYDCVEWIASQTWSNGKVGTWGPSALGRIQFLTAAKNPPHLTCICPSVAGPQYDYTEYFPHGALRTEYVQQLDALGFGLSAILMAHTVHDNVWTFVETQNMYPDSIRVPCFMIGGWYDHTVEFMLQFFEAIRTKSPLIARDHHRLLMGPWVHGGSGIAQVGSSVQGELSYPNASKWNDSLALLFFDYHLRGQTNNWNTTAFVQYYQMGDNTWQTSPTWPPAGTSNTDFYLNKFNNLWDSPPTTTLLEFLSYDPHNPSPTIGGPTLKKGLKQGPYDQRDSVESRSDILIFSTSPLVQNVVMKGSATVHLRVSSDHPDTDFGVRLCDVYPDGRSMIVNDGIMRMRFRNGNTAADTAAMSPSSKYDCVIQLPNTAITFLTGHKIRLDITGSNYPRFNCNMNTGGPMYPDNNMDTLVNAVTAINMIHSSTGFYSRITMPLVGYKAGINTSHGTANGFEVYPNPAGDQLRFTNYELRGENCYSIYNSFGQIVLEGTLMENETIIDIVSLSTGIYFIRATTGKQEVYNKKIVVAK